MERGAPLAKDVEHWLSRVDAETARRTRGDDG